MIFKGRTGKENTKVCYNFTKYFVLNDTKLEIKF